LLPKDQQAARFKVAHLLTDHAAALHDFGVAHGLRIIKSLKGQELPPACSRTWTQTVATSDSRSVDGRRACRHAVSWSMQATDGPREGLNPPRS